MAAGWVMEMEDMAWIPILRPIRAREADGILLLLRDFPKQMRWGFPQNYGKLPTNTRAQQIVALKWTAAKWKFQASLPLALG